MIQALMPILSQLAGAVGMAGTSNALSTAAAGAPAAAIEGAAARSATGLTQGFGGAMDLVLGQIKKDPKERKKGSSTADADINLAEYVVGLDTSPTPSSFNIYKGFTPAGE